MAYRKVIQSTITFTEENFLNLFLEFLDTGVNKINSKNYMAMHNRVVEECDDRDHPEQMYTYCKDLIKEFI